MVSGCGRTERCYIQIRVDDGMRGGESRRVVVVLWPEERTRCVYGRFVSTHRGEHEDLRTVDRIQNSGRLPSPRAVMRSILSFHNDRVPSRSVSRRNFNTLVYLTNVPLPLALYPSVTARLAPFSTVFLIPEALGLLLLFSRRPPRCPLF